MSLKETCSAYSTPMMDFYPDFKFTKKVGLIELFAGYGSQSLALEYLGVDFTHIGISEWNWKSVLAYKKLHFPNDVVDYSSTLSDGDLASLLFSFGISSDWNLPMSESEIKRLRNKREIYNAIVATKDHPDISKAKGSDFFIRDRSDFQTILTYSFPCQDLSNAGTMAGMDEGSETRSSLLWQVRRIISEMGEIGQLPDFLLMENVPGVAGEKNLKNLDKWISFLESLGYKNKLQIMEATEFGIPQTRKRAFLVSVLGDYSYSFPGKIELSNRLRGLLEEDVDEKYYLSEKMLNYFKITQSKGFKVPDAIINPKCSRTISADYGGQRGGIDTHVSESLPDDFNATKQNGFDREIAVDPEIAKTICATMGKMHKTDNYVSEKEFTYFDSYNKKEHENVVGTLTMPNHNSAYIIEREASGVYCGQSKDFQRGPLPGSSRTIKAEIADACVIVPSAAKKGYEEAGDGDGVYINHLKGKRGTVQHGFAQTIKTSPDTGVVQLGNVIPLCLNPVVDGKQPSIENRVYSSDGTSTAVTASFPTKYNIGLRIRKLTPRECFRLMGVSDDRSQSLISSFPDSVLYHLAGDSIVTTCLMAIFSQCFGIDWVAKAKEAKLF
jgi:DNA-methyltransferase (dcm)